MHCVSRTRPRFIGEVGDRSSRVDGKSMEMITVLANGLCSTPYHRIMANSPLAATGPLTTALLLYPAHKRRDRHVQFLGEISSEGSPF